MKRILIALLIFCIALMSMACSSPAPQDTQSRAALPSVPEETPVPFSADMVEMEQTDRSSCFSSVGYDVSHTLLVVQFRDSGSVYAYSNFPEEAYEDFINAESLGKHYNSSIKGQYPCERVS